MVLFSQTEIIVLSRFDCEILIYTGATHEEVPERCNGHIYYFGDDIAAFYKLGWFTNSREAVTLFAFAVIVIVVNKITDILF